MDDGAKSSRGPLPIANFARRGPASMSIVGSVFMKQTGLRNAAYGAEKIGLQNAASIHWNFLPPQLYEHAIRDGEATIVGGGPLCADPGVHTGRSPKDKAIVADETTEKNIWW
jgi:phosphoenolpyruvate carboxykinase (ATP)